MPILAKNSIISFTHIATHGKIDVGRATKFILTIKRLSKSYLVLIFIKNLTIILMA